MSASRPDHPLVLQSRVPDAAEGRLVLDFLVARFPYLGTTRWRQELAAGRVRLDGRVAGESDVLRRHSQIAWTKVEAEPFADASFAVLHEDADLLVVDKPAHLAMHADGPFVRKTLVHALRAHAASAELALVHRLDRETSGVCVVAKTPAARTALTAQFAAGCVHKVYLAVVRGLVAADFTVDAGIGRSSTSCIQLRRAAGAASISPQPAQTRFRVLERGPAATLLRCEPATGRTHQIRVHAEFAGHAILGDKLYGRPDADYLAFVRDVKQSGDARLVPAGEPDRHLLHAAELTFDHPSRHERLTFRSPTPACFLTWLRAAGSDGSRQSSPREGGGTGPDAADGSPNS